MKKKNLFIGRLVIWNSLPGQSPFSTPSKVVEIGIRTFTVLDFQNFQRHELDLFGGDGYLQNLQPCSKARAQTYIQKREAELRKSALSAEAKAIELSGASRLYSFNTRQALQG